MAAILLLSYFWMAPAYAFQRGGFATRRKAALSLPALSKRQNSKQRHALRSRAVSCLSQLDGVFRQKMSCENRFEYAAANH
jgi:hypothetical protein